MTQPDLLEHAARPHAYDDASREAFTRLRATLPEREHACFVALWTYVTRSGYGDATGGELAAFMGLDRTQVRPRLTALLQRKLIEKTPIRQSRYGGETRCHGVRPCVPLAAVERMRKERAA